MLLVGDHPQGRVHQILAEVVALVRAGRLYEHVGQDVAALGKVAGFDQATAVGRLVFDRKPHMPAAQARLRGHWAGQLIISGLADLEHHYQNGTGVDPDEHVTSLIDAVTGLLTAPSSTEPN